MWDEWGNFELGDLGNDLFPGETGGFDVTFDDGSSVPVFTDVPALDGGGGWGGWDLSGILDNVQDVFKIALQLNSAYKAAGKPAVRASTPETTANANGTLSTKTASGGTVTVKMTPGTPYVTASGAVVTNNGDGTYTTIQSDGSTVVRQYPAGAPSNGALTSNPLFWAGLGLAAFLVVPRLMPRR